MFTRTSGWCVCGVQIQQWATCAGLARPLDDRRRRLTAQAFHGGIDRRHQRADRIWAGLWAVGIDALALFRQPLLLIHLRSIAGATFAETIHSRHAAGGLGPTNSDGFS